MQHHAQTAPISIIYNGPCILPFKVFVVQLWISCQQFQVLCQFSWTTEAADIKVRARRRQSCIVFLSGTHYYWYYIVPKNQNKYQQLTTIKTTHLTIPCSGHGLAGSEGVVWWPWPWCLSLAASRTWNMVLVLNKSWPWWKSLEIFKTLINDNTNVRTNMCNILTVKL